MCARLSLLHTKERNFVYTYFYDLITDDALFGGEEADVLWIRTNGMHSLATVVDFFRQLPTIN